DSRLSRQRSLGGRARVVRKFAVLGAPAPWIPRRTVLAPSTGTAIRLVALRGGMRWPGCRDAGPEGRRTPSASALRRSALSESRHRQAASRFHEEDAAGRLLVDDNGQK